MSSVTIPAQPEKILHALAEVWTALGEEERQQGKPTVVRACAMTLIVITDQQDRNSLAALQTVTELMHAHPSRAIILRSDQHAENGLSARVFAQCWKPFGKAQQICCEQIEVSANAERWSEMGPTVVGTVVPDLPVVVWCRQQSVLREPGVASGLESIFSLSNKIIVDTRDLDVKPALQVMAEWRRNGYTVADLQWTRLTPWRETLATVFERDLGLAKRGLFDRVEIGYNGKILPASVCYMAAWIERGLGIKATFVTEESQEPGLSRVTLHSSVTPIEMARAGSTCMDLKVGDQQQRISLAGSSLYEMMLEELTVLAEDPIFESVFARVGGYLG